MRYFSFFLLFLATGLAAQTEDNLIASFSFNDVNCTAEDDRMDPDITTVPTAVLACECGVKDNAVRFDGDNDWFLVAGNKIDILLGKTDFTFSFYFKPLSGNSADAETLFTKKNDCSSTDSLFAVRYVPATRLLSVEMKEGAINGNVSKVLPNNSCWYHITIVRLDGETILYLNGSEIERKSSASGQRVDILNQGQLIVGGDNCSSGSDFNGLLDEIRLYNRALTRNEVEGLYLAPDQIANDLDPLGINEIVISLGTSAQVELTNTCAVGFEWLPNTNISDPTVPEPLLSPTVTTTYSVAMDDGILCFAFDTLRVIVVDPATLDCRNILLPTAFTPNTDNLNDTYGISNPAVVDELLTFEIFDRWGNIVFSATDPLQHWDGSYKGRAVDPGVFLYKIHFRCKGEEGVKSGSVTVIR